MPEYHYHSFFPFHLRPWPKYYLYKRNPHPDLQIYVLNVLNGLNYPLNKYGYSLWKIGGDRKINFNEYSNRKENYHHPRHLIYNILSIQRIISNNYK